MVGGSLQQSWALPQLDNRTQFPPSNRRIDTIRRQIISTGLMDRGCPLARPVRVLRRVGRRNGEAFSPSYQDRRRSRQRP